MIRSTIRSLLKAPMFSSLVVTTLALGIGANTATFSVLKSIALNPLPYGEPDRLVVIAEADSHTPNPRNVAYATMREWQVRCKSFERLSMWGDYSLRPVRQGRADFLRGMGVSYDFFDTLGIRMSLGRTFTEEDDRPETADKLILSYPLWINYFGGDPNILGRRIQTLGDSTFTVIGVLPATFHPLHMSNPGEIPQYYVPLGFGAEERACHSCRSRRVIGRLKAGVTPIQARTELNGIMRHLVREYPNDYARDASAFLTPLREQLIGRFDTALFVLFGAVGLLLLLACSNAANLLLARATGRQTEMALRASLGAGRWRLARLVLTESLLLSLAGGLAGVICAFFVTRLIAHTGASEIPRIDETGPDVFILSWGLGVSVFTGLIFGIVPALAASRIDLRPALQGATNASMFKAKHGFLHSLIAAEIALAFVLALDVGVLGKSYMRLTEVNPGYDSQNVLTLSILPPAPSRATPEKLLSEYDSVVNHVRAISDVEDAGYASTLPLSHPQTNRFYIRENGLVAKTEAPQMNTYFVSPGYLRTMKIALVRGRLIDERDRRGLAPVALVSETCAREQFAGRDPLGQHIQLDERDEKRPWTTVVGVVRDVHQYGLDKPADPSAYFAYAQAENPQGFASLVVRSHRRLSRSIEEAVRSALHAADPRLPVFHLQPMDAYTAKSLAARTFAFALISVFGALALLLAAVGIYGVVAYAVGQRTREVGIRMALGAEPRDIYRLILRQVVMSALVGLGVGFGLSFWTGRAMRDLLFEVAPNDGATMGWVAALICLVALASGYIPCERAVRLAPVRAMKIE